MDTSGTTEAMLAHRANKVLSAQTTAIKEVWQMDDYIRNQLAPSVERRCCTERLKFFLVQRTTARNEDELEACNSAEELLLMYVKSNNLKAPWWHFKKIEEIPDKLLPTKLELHDSDIGDSTKSTGLYLEPNAIASKVRQYFEARTFRENFNGKLVSAVVTDSAWNDVQFPNDYAALRNLLLTVDNHPLSSIEFHNVADALKLGINLESLLSTDSSSSVANQSNVIDTQSTLTGSDSESDSDGDTGSTYESNCKFSHSHDCCDHSNSLCTACYQLASLHLRDPNQSIVILPPVIKPFH